MEDKKKSPKTIDVPKGTANGTSNPSTPVTPVVPPAAENPPAAGGVVAVVPPPAEGVSKSERERQIRKAWREKMKALQAERDKEIESLPESPKGSRGSKDSASYKVRAMFLKDQTLKAEKIVEALKGEFPEIKLPTVSALCSDAKGTFTVLKDLGMIKE